MVFLHALLYGNYKNYKCSYWAGVKCECKPQLKFSEILTWHSHSQKYRHNIQVRQGIAQFV